VLRSSIITLSASRTQLPLGGCYGFALTAAAGGSGQTWPVAVEVVTRTGSETLLARAGVWYAIGAAIESAHATLAPGAAAASYQLDGGRAPDAAAVPASSAAASPSVEGAGTNDVPLPPAVGAQHWRILARLQRPPGATGLLVGIHNPTATEVVLALRELAANGERIGGARATGGGLKDANEENDTEPVQAFTPAVLYGAGSATVKWNVSGTSLTTAIFSQPSAPPPILEVLVRNYATTGADIPVGAITYSFRFW
jgi:hypothetical protein